MVVTKEELLGYTGVEFESGNNIAELFIGAAQNIVENYLGYEIESKENGILENWNETVDRIYGMHEVKLKELGLFNDLTKKALNKAKKFEYNKVILSSQRGRQFASSNKNSGILKHEAKIYNCSSTFIDRPKVFSEIMYLLLCGCGVGYSLHKEYIEKLPRYTLFACEGLIK